MAGALIMEINERSLTRMNFRALTPRILRSANSHNARNALGFRACAFSMMSNGGSCEAVCCMANTFIMPSSSFGEQCSKT